MKTTDKLFQRNLSIMSRFGLLNRLLPIRNISTINKPIIFESSAVASISSPVSVAPVLIQMRGAKVKAGAGGAGGAGGKGGKKGASMVKPDLDVETDAKKLVSTVCGLNYRIDGDQEAVKIRPDSEYPDWLWTLSVERPLPPLEEQDPNTKEYWLQVVRDMKRRSNRLGKVYKKK